MRTRMGITVLLSIALISGLAFSAADSATVTDLEGTVMVMAPGAESGTPLGPDGTVSQNDSVLLGTGARVSLEFDDGSTLSLTGPAHVIMSELSEYARTIDLVSGTINEFVVNDITSGVRAPYASPDNSFVAVRNGTIQVKVETLESGNQITYKLFEGEDAKVVDGRELRVLTTDAPIVIQRTPDSGTPGIDTSGLAGISSKTEGNVTSFVLGFNQISLEPADGFEIIPTGEGGIKVVCVLPDGQFGTVSVNNETPYQQSFYLANGDSIEFDAGGNITRQDAIAHIYATLDVRGNYDEAVADPSDASPISVR